MVYLNIASNGIKSEGFIQIFKSLRRNESLVELNVSTIDGIDRNRMNMQAVTELKKTL